jgi:hypothetical protein
MGHRYEVYSIVTLFGPSRVLFNGKYISGMGESASKSSRRNFSAFRAGADIMWIGSWKNLFKVGMSFDCETGNLGELVTENG